MLTSFDALPEGFLQASARTLHQCLPGPALIHLPGRRPEPLFVSVMLHGNEDTGLKAIQQVLRHYSHRPLPRALSLFVGNVTAAREGMRRLDGQPDYNRVWPGTDTASCAETALMAQVTAAMRARRVFASIDIHNNTGLNPHYGCVNRLDPRYLHLARLFSRIVVYFTQPRGVQSAAFARFCPAVTVECGKPGVAAAEHHAAEFVDAALHLDHFPEHPVPAHDIDLYRTIGVAAIPEAVHFSFREAADLVLPADLDQLNFRDVPAGTSFGRVNRSGTLPLSVHNGDRQVAADYFAIHEGELRTIRPLMPAMLTLDERVIRQDCLCYIMERLPYPLPTQMARALDEVEG